MREWITLSAANLPEAQKYRLFDSKRCYRFCTYFRPHRMLMCVSGPHRWAVQKRLNRSISRFRGLTHVGPRNYVLVEFQIPQENALLREENGFACYRVRQINAKKNDKLAMRPLAKLLWTLVNLTPADARSVLSLSQSLSLTYVASWSRSCGWRQRLDTVTLWPLTAFCAKVDPVVVHYINSDDRWMGKHYAYVVCNCRVWNEDLFIHLFTYLSVCFFCLSV